MIYWLIDEGVLICPIHLDKKLEREIVAIKAKVPIKVNKRLGELKCSIETDTKSMMVNSILNHMKT